MKALRELSEWPYKKKRESVIVTRGEAQRSKEEDSDAKIRL